MAYSWEYVHNYDIVFRQLMEFNPERSWVVTYNQMWNLSMTNPIVAGYQQRRSFGRYGSAAGSTSNLAGFQESKKKIDYCWSFNKRVKCKFGRKCKFIEECSYCDSAAHGVINCDKLDRRDKETSCNMGHKGRSKLVG